MIEILPLNKLDGASLVGMINGYISNEKYSVSLVDTEEAASISLLLTRLPAPYIKHFETPPEDVTRYQEVIQAGWSLAAYDGAELVAIALAEPQWWNNTLWIWEFKVAESHQQMGIGRRLMDHLAERAGPAGLRTMLVETQSTNLLAIRFYRRVGFAIEGIDTSYYTNQDYPDGEMAIFMKRRL